MSMTFVPSHMRGKTPPTQASIQKMLDENNQLIQTIVDYQNRGKATECVQYQQILHRNLVYLATIADSNQNVQLQALIPAAGQNNQNSQQSGMMGQQRPQQPMPNQMQPNLGKGPMASNSQLMMSQSNGYTPSTSQHQPPMMSNSYNQQQQQQMNMMSPQQSGTIPSSQQQGMIPQQQNMMSSQQSAMPQQNMMSSQQQMVSANQQPAMSGQQPPNMMSPSQNSVSQNRKQSAWSAIADQLSSGPGTNQKGAMPANNQMMMGTQQGPYNTQNQPPQAQMGQQNNYNPAMGQQPPQQGAPPSQPMMNQAGMKISRSTTDQLSSKINSSMPMNTPGPMPGHPNYVSSSSQQPPMSAQNNFGGPMPQQQPNLMSQQGRKMNWSGTVAEQLSSKLIAKQNAQNKGPMMSNQSNLQAPFNNMSQQNNGFPNQQQPMMSQSQPMMSQQSNMNPQMMSQGNNGSNPLMSRGQMPPPSSYRRSPSTGPQFQGQVPQNFNSQMNQTNFPQGNFNQGNMQGQLQYQNQQGFQYRGQNPMQAQMSRPMGQGQVPSQMGQGQMNQGQIGNPMASSMPQGPNNNGQVPMAGSQMPNQMGSRLPNMAQNSGQMLPNMVPTSAGTDSNVPNSMPQSSMGQMAQPPMSGQGQMVSSNVGSQMSQGQMQQPNMPQGQMGGQMPNQGQAFGYIQNQF
ncbi:protein SSXT-like isoform X2 [Lineus longissimus]|uniref:protein SSXT-like isoform X2 n=1 Tax=Lineus longissimus TaxID=88925 RepID=UPI00315DCDD9